MSYEIPIINIAPFLDPDTTQVQKDAIVSGVRNACQKYGFFQLEGHGIPVKLQKKMIDCSRLFFDLPQDEKNKLSMKNALGQSNRGYELIGGQKLQSDALADLKEGLYIGEEIHPDDARAGKFLQGPNLWLETLPDDTFRTPITEYRERLVALAHSLLTIIALGLPYGPEIFDEFRLQPVANVRLLHYPPQKSTDEMQLGAGAHTDFGCITILLQQPDQHGLEVLYQPTDRWIPVPAVFNRYIVNIGDLLDGWTRGKYRSAIHRAVNISGEHRYSVPFFYSGNMGFQLRPLDGSDDENSTTVEKHIRNKFSKSYAIKASA